MPVCQVAAVQTGAMQLSVDIFNPVSTGQHDLKTDIQIKGVSVTKVTFASEILLLFFNDVTKLKYKVYRNSLMDNQTGLIVVKNIFFLILL